MYGPCERVSLWVKIEEANLIIVINVRKDGGKGKGEWLDRSGWKVPHWMDPVHRKKYFYGGYKSADNGATVALFATNLAPPLPPSSSSFSSLKNSLEFSDEWAKVLRELRESNLHSSAVQRVDFPSLLSIAATRQLNGTQKCTKSQSIQSPRILIERRQVESTQLTMETWWNQPEGKQIKIEPVDGAGQMKWKQPAPGRGLNDNRNGVG